MAKLLDIDNFGVETLMDLISNNDVILYEDLCGSRIYVNVNRNKINIRPRTIKNDELNLIDLAYQKYYQNAIEHFKNLDKSVLKLMPNSWWFEFQYFPDEQPAHTRYDRIPKNGLVLTDVVTSKNRDLDLGLVEEWSNLLEVEALPVLYNGKLSDEQLQKIRYFLELDPKDSRFLFKGKNFVEFFYNLLCPYHDSSFMMNSGNYQDNLRNFVLYFKGRKKNLRFNLINPWYERIRNVKVDFDKTYERILSSFLESFEASNLDAVKIPKGTKNEMMLYILSHLYCEWMDMYSDKIENFDFVVPAYFEDSKFRLNVDLIPLNNAKNYMLKNDKLEFCFRVLLDAFNKDKKLKNTISEKILLHLNKATDKINKILDERLSIVRSEFLRKRKLIDFSEFDMFYYDSSDPTIYPDVFKQEEIGNLKKSKNKKK